MGTEKLFSTSNVAQGIYNRLTSLETTWTNFGTQINAKAPIVSPTFTGLVTADGNADEKIRFTGSNGPYLNALDAGGGSMGYLSWFKSGGNAIATLAAQTTISSVINGTEVTTVNSAGLTVNGVLTMDNAAFAAGMVSGNPQINFDSGDALKYDRAANKFYFIIGNTAVASIDASGNLRCLGTVTGSVTP